MKPSGSPSEIILELAEEFIDRYRQGERPSLREFIDRCPELADEVRVVFPAMALMEDIAIGDPSLVGGSNGERSSGGARSACPERFGDYRIIREIGRGGMGIVYEAEQVSLGRHVALKALPQVMIHDACRLARFEREARAAAKLHHTNIVPVFGVGEQGGTPYYVMQFISGLGLDAVLDELCRLHGKEGPGPNGLLTDALPVAHRGPMAAAVTRSLLTGRFEKSAGSGPVPRSGPRGALAETLSMVWASLDATDDPNAAASRPEIASSVALGGSPSLSASDVLSGHREEGPSHRPGPSTYWQRVALIGAQAADALDYAHQQGVLHRDIKPSNLLLDVRGTVWVADFGLAKSSDQHDLTQTGDILGTLRYMPPEAFEGRVGARGDIYSLGLSLYELLAFRPAFEEQDRNRLVKLVTSEEPPRLRSLNPGVPRDLETIVHKAIERDPNHRYGTSGELAADLQRFINDESILARRATPIERCARWCRRNRMVAGLAASLIGLLIVATVTTSIGLARMSRLAKDEHAARKLAEKRKGAAERARHEAESALRDVEAHRRRAEANFAKARAAVDEYLTKISENRLLDVPGLQPLRRELLESALHFYEGFLKEHGDDPTIRVGLASAEWRMGGIFRLLDMKDKAATAFGEARRLYREASRQNPDDRQARYGLALALIALGQPDAAITEWKWLVRADPENLDYQSWLVTAYQRQSARIAAGPAYGRDSASYARALEPLREALTLLAGLVRSDKEDARSRIQLGQSLNNLGQGPRFQMQVAQALRKLGQMLSRRGHHIEAIALHERAVATTRRYLEDSPDNSYLGSFMAVVLGDMGDAHRELAENDAAALHYREAADIARRLAVKNLSVGEFQQLFYTKSEVLSRALREFGETFEAANVMRQARVVLEQPPPSTAEDFYRLAVVRAYCAATAPDRESVPELAGAERERARAADQAIEALSRAVDLGLQDFEQLKSGDDFEALRARDDFKQLVSRAERLAKARETAGANGAAPNRQRPAEPDNRAPGKRAADVAALDRQARGDIAAGHHAIALVLLDLDRPDEALAALEEARSLREQLVREGPEDDRARAEWAATTIARGRALIARGRQERKAGRTDDAERLRREGEDLWSRAERRAPGPRDHRIDRAPILQAVGGEQARRGLWAEAAMIYGRHDDHLTETFRGHARATRACFLIMAGDRDGYRRLCGAALDRDGRSGGRDARLLAVCPCVLAPDGLADFQALVRSAEQAVRAGEDRPDGRLYVLGAACYRAGQYDRAVANCRKSAASEWKGAMLNWPVLALALYRLGNRDEARHAHEQARRMAGLDRHGRFDWDRAIVADPCDFMVRMEMTVWLREAETVMVLDPAFPADPFAP